MRSTARGRAGTGRRTVAALLLAPLLLGCGGTSAVSGDAHTIFVHGRSLLPRGGDDAIVEGRLVLRDGCVLLDQEAVGVAYPVIWPSRTSIVDTDPFTLRLPSGARLTVGQVVSGGGGYHQASSDHLGVDIPTACVPDTGEVAVFNPDDDPSVID